MYFFEDDDAVIFDYPTFNPAFKMNPEYKLLGCLNSHRLAFASVCNLDNGVEAQDARGGFVFQQRSPTLGPLTTGQGLNWKYSNITSTCSALLFSYVPRILISEVDEGSDCNLGFGSPPHSWMRYCLP